MTETTDDLADEHWERGADHYAAGRMGEAVAEWRAGLALNPRHADLHYNLGVALSEGGQRGEAAAHWREAIRLRPDFSEAHLNLVCDLAGPLEGSKDKARWREARELCHRTLALQPQEGPYHTYLLELLGAVQWELGERLAAAGSLKAALAAAPDDQWALGSLARMQQRTGDWRGSWRTLSALFALPDFDPTPYVECERRLRLIGLGLVVVVGGIWLFKKRRG